MIDNLVFSAENHYNLSYKDKDDSLRVSTAGTVVEPRTISIRSQPYVDSTTKVAGKRTSLRTDAKYIDEATGAPGIVSITCVLAIPDNVPLPVLEAVLANFRDLVSASSNCGNTEPVLAAVIRGEK